MNYTQLKCSLMNSDETTTTIELQVLPPTSVPVLLWNPSYPAPVDLGLLLLEKNSLNFQFFL